MSKISTVGGNIEQNTLSCQIHEMSSMTKSGEEQVIPGYPREHKEIPPAGEMIPLVVHIHQGTEKRKINDTLGRGDS